MRRKNGFERPFTNDQLLSWFAEPTAAAIFYLVAVPFTHGTTRTVLVTVYSVLLVTHLACWLYCSLPDPSEEKGMFWPCMKEAQKESRYCAVCRKNVPGLDHHCTWLNTCIGRRQYPAFFALVTIGTFMYWFETAFLIWLLTGGLTPQVQAEAEDTLGSVTTYKVLLSIATLFTGSVAIGLTVLFSFHMFLQFVGMGTYAWMIDGRTRRYEARNAKKDTSQGQNENKPSSSKSCSRGDTNSEKVVVTV